MGVSEGEGENEGGDKGGQHEGRGGVEVSEAPCARNSATSKPMPPAPTMATDLPTVARLVEGTGCGVRGTGCEREEAAEGRLRESGGGAAAVKRYVRAEPRRARLVRTS